MTPATPLLATVETRTMICPRCEREQPMRDLVKPGTSPLYAPRLMPIYPRGGGSHGFSLCPVISGAA
jgi:hypothetical protein